MSDRSNGWIQILGPFPENKLDELAELLASDGPGPDWGESFDDADEARDFLEEAGAPGGDGLVKLYDDQATGGEFHSLMDFLRNLKIPHVYGWDGCSGAYDGGFGRYTPEDGLLTMSGSEDSGPTVGLKEIEEAIKAGVLNVLLDEMRSIRLVDPELTTPFRIGGPLNLALDAALASAPK